MKTVEIWLVNAQQGTLANPIIPATKLILPLSTFYKDRLKVLTRVTVTRKLKGDSIVLALCWERIAPTPDDD